MAATFEEMQDEISALDVDAQLRRLRENEARARFDEAERAVLLAQLEADATYKADGHASMYGLLRSALGWSDGECRTHMQIARLVDAYPDAGEALFEAWASIANIASIARAFANPRCGEAIDPAIGNMLTEAARLEHADFRHIPERWQLLNDPGTSSEHSDADDNRSSHFGLAGGKGTLGCEWGALDAARNREVYDKFCEAEFEADWAWTVEQYGDKASTALMPRTAAQRAADAVTAIFQRAAATARGAKPPKPVGVVHVDWQTYRDWMVEAGLFPERFATDPFDDPAPLVSRLRCETGDGTLISPDHVMRVLLEGYVRFVIHNDEGVPIHWGRQRRMFEGAARDAVMCLAPRCTHPGCAVRGHRNQSDHLKPWSEGGETSPDNGAPRCPRHNRLRNHGYTVHRDSSGHWHTYRPDGTEIR
jgi:hypothetical protein